MHKKRSKLWAILGASVLTLGVVSIALAATLKVEHQGTTISWDENGDPVVEGGFAGGNINGEECTGEDLDEGEVLIHFVQSGGGQEDPVTPNPGGNAANLLDVFLTDEADVLDVAADDVKENNVDWFVSLIVTDGEVTIDSAESNVDGGELRISHICIGDAPPEETAPPSFEQSQEGETDEPSEPVITDEPSVPADTDEPSFEQSQEGETDAPTEPNTAALGTNGTSAPADGAWLLVVALGVLLASIVVLSPARAKGTR